MRFDFKVIQAISTAFLVILFSIPASAVTTSEDVQDRISSASSSTLPSKCRDHLEKAHGSDKKSVEIGLVKELAEFRPLAEQALSLRAETIAVGKRIKAQIDRKNPLSGDDLAILNVGITEHLALRAKLLEIAEMHECWLEGTEKEWLARGVTPEARLEGVMLSLSSAFLLYDNYLLSISLFEGDPKLRRLLNEADKGYAVNSAALAKVTLHYNSISNRSRVRRAIKFFEHESKRFSKNHAFSEKTAYLDLQIGRAHV